MRTLTFTIKFHGPFRVSAGHGRGGVDDVLDQHDWLPATSLKGVMRATAKNLLGPDSDHVQEVFGGDHGPSPWRWSSARPDGEGWFEPYPAARIAIDEATHTARDDMLAFAEQTAADRATFTVTQFGHIDGDTMRRHELVLAISGQATRSIGALRRRGLGWVSIRCTDRHLDEDAVDEFMELISR